MYNYLWRCAMKAEDVQTRELRMWRVFGGLTMGLIIGATIVASFRQELGSFQFTWWLLGSLIGLWFIALPVVYLIDIRPRKRKENKIGNAKINKV